MTSELGMRGQVHCALCDRLGTTLLARGLPQPHPTPLPAHAPTPEELPPGLGKRHHPAQLIINTVS